MNKQLIQASKSGNLDLVKELISKGADIHVGYDLALRWASENGHLEVVKFLVREGADIHAVNEQSLRLARSCGYLEVANYLEGRIVRENLLNI